MSLGFRRPVAHSGQKSLSESPHFFVGLLDAPVGGECGGAGAFFMQIRGGIFFSLIWVWCGVLHTGAVCAACSPRPHHEQHSHCIKRISFLLKLLAYRYCVRAVCF